MHVMSGNAQATGPEVASVRLTNGSVHGCSVQSQARKNPVACRLGAPQASVLNDATVLMLQLCLLLPLQHHTACRFVLFCSAVQCSFAALQLRVFANSVCSAEALCETLIADTVCTTWQTLFALFAFQSNANTVSAPQTLFANLLAYILSACPML